MKLLEIIPFTSSPFAPESLSYFSTKDFKPGDLVKIALRAKETWGLVRTLATGFLVVIMLIMVFSQAVGGGPFDAYTVRKMLPKLVAAAILIQISWPLFSWIVGLFDDAGRGLADILYAPFGGKEALSLGHLLPNARIYTNQAIAINWVGIAAGLVLGTAALPVVLFFVFAAIVSFGTAIAVLVFRKILIIMLLILSPLALLAWILPGTKKYWDLWSQNFVKLLAMFPLVVALVASGRIFAYVVGTQNNGEFLNLLLIMIGVFGPLFLLPKTFKWGGSALTLAGNAITGLGSKVQQAGKEPVKGIGQRWQGARAKQYDPNAHWSKRALRRVQSGHFIPPVPGLKGAAERSRRLTIAAGDKWANERNDEAAALVNRTYEKALNGYEMYDMKDGKFGEFTRHHGAEKVDAAGKIVREGDLLDEHGNKANRLTAQFAEKTRETAYKQTATGVEAGKQALIDITGYDGTDVQIRAAQAAHKQLLDTKSEIELQGSYIQSGDNAGKRASEVRTWDITLANSPPHYGAVNASRPDFAPDVKQSAEARASQFLERPVTYEGTKATDTATLKVLDKERLGIALERLTPETLQSSHYGLFDDIARLDDAELSTKLAQTLAKFDAVGGVVGANAVGSLRGGKEDHVNDALRLAGHSLDSLPPYVPPSP